MALDFPSPATDGQVWEGDNGVVYTFVSTGGGNGHWSGVQTNTGKLDDIYVQVAGDNMTGNLTLGTDKITLNAANGSASFTGKVTSASTEDSDSDTTLVTKDYVDSNSGATYWDRTGTTLSPSNAGDSVDIGSGSITLNATGIINAGIYASTSNRLLLDGGNSGSGYVDNAINGSVMTRLTTGGDFYIGGSMNPTQGGETPNITLKANGEIITTADANINGVTVGRGGGNSTVNTALGRNALRSNTTGQYNTATGLSALYTNTTGTRNTANGTNALTANTEGNDNTATGDNALKANTTGLQNVATGTNALGSNLTGEKNVATGHNALLSNTGGSENVATGRLALYGNITGYNNVAIGSSAGFYIEGSNNTILGPYKGTAADATLNDTVIISAGTTERLRIDDTALATFAGKVTSASTEDTDGGTTLVTKDYLTGGGSGGTGTLGYWNRTGTDLSPVNAGDTVKIGGTLPSTPNITLNANGNITTVGKILSERPNATDFAFEVKQGSTRTAYQTNDGSIRVGGSLSNATNPSPNITLNADGSGEFTGDVTSGSGSFSTGNNAALHANGNISVSRSGVNEPIFYGFTAGTTSPTMRILNGGNVQIGGDLVSNPPVPNISLKNNGEIIATADATINRVTVGRGGGNDLTNMAVGHQALIGNETGTDNTATGTNTLAKNLAGVRNTAVGNNAGYFIEGSNNTILGAYQGTNADASLNDTVIISAGRTERLRIDSSGAATFAGTVTADSFISTGGGGGLSPTGSVTMFAGATVPDGWLECNGQTAPSALAAVLGQANVPDLRGEFVRGFDNGRGIDAGRNLLSAQDDTVANHTHTYNVYNSAGGNYNAQQQGSNAFAGTGITNAGGGGYETRPRNVALMYIIKT